MHRAKYFIVFILFSRVIAVGTAADLLKAAAAKGAQSVSTLGTREVFAQLFKKFNAEGLTSREAFTKAHQIICKSSAITNSGRSTTLFALVTSGKDYIGPVAGVVTIVTHVKGWIWKSKAEKALDLEAERRLNAVKAEESFFASLVDHANEPKAANGLPVASQEPGIRYEKYHGTEAFERQRQAFIKKMAIQEVQK